MLYTGFPAIIVSNSLHLIIAALLTAFSPELRSRPIECYHRQCKCYIQYRLVLGTKRWRGPIWWVIILSASSTNEGAEFVGIVTKFTVRTVPIGQVRRLKAAQTLRLGTNFARFGAATELTAVVMPVIYW